MKKILPALSILFFLEAPAQNTFQKTIAAGSTQFAASASASADGGFVLAGDIYVTTTNTDMYIIKLNAKGDLQWDKSIDGTQYDHATKIIQTKDGGYAVGGNSGDNKGTYVRLVKLDQNGNVQWSKYYSANKYNGANTLVQTPDGGYAVGGYTQTYSNGSAGFLIKTDADGNLVWSKRIFDISFYPSIQALVNTSDGGFAAVLNARTTNSYYDMYLVKLTGNGAFQWARSIGGLSTDMPKFVLQTADKGYLFGGSSFSFSNNQEMFVVKADSSGNKKWSEIIGTKLYDYATDAVELPGKLYVIAGVTQDSSLRNQPYAVLLNKDGDLQKSRIVASPVSTLVSTVARLANGTVVLAGRDPRNVYVAKFDANGNVCGDTKKGGATADTADLLVQTVPVANLSPIVTTGSETATEQAGVVSSICTGAAASISQGSSSESTLTLLIYPNPVKDQLIMQLHSRIQTMVQIEIVAFNGKTMWKDNSYVPSNSIRQINVSKWQKGVYYVIVQDGDQTRRFNFLKE